ncbi:MAG: (2Fe-2S)-binding protein, partial [Pseudomonadota bacterium]
KLNGRPVSLTVDSQRTLLWVLRADLGVTGPKYGCGEGLCGACTVLLDQEAVQSCQIPVKAAEGKEVLTIEGLEKEGRLHPLQKAFIKHDAMQCGFCTSGMIMKAHSLLAQNPQPAREDLIKKMDQILCRCGAHKRIIEAIQNAAREMKGV